MTRPILSPLPLWPAWVWVVALSCGLAHSVLGIGDVWQTRAPSPVAMNLNAVVHTGSQWVAIGEEGAITTSPDAVTWTQHSSPLPVSLHALSWNGSILAAVGDEGAIATSTDGTLWIKRDSPVAISLRSIVWTGARFVAAGEGGIFITSTDAITWSPVFSSNTSDWFGLASNGSLLVAVGSKGAISTSSSGLVWTPVTSGTTRTLRSVAHNGTTWVVVGETGTVLTSLDGASWQAVSSPASSRLYHIMWDGGQFIALGDDGLAIISTDGQTWSTQALVPAVSFASAAVAAGMIIAVGEHGIITSAPVAAGPWVERSSGARESVHDSVWTGTQFVAVGTAGTIRTSPDGVTWTEQTSGIPATLNGIAWTGTRLIAVGDAGTIVTSTDGVAWTAQTSGTTRPLFAITWTGSSAIAVGQRGVVAASSNGLSWSTSTLAGTPTLRSIATVGTQTIAAGENGAIQTFSGGTWTARTSGTSHDLTAVAYNGQTAIAGGQHGSIYTTSNLVTWTSVTSTFAGLPEAGIHGAKWTGTEFVIVGHEGTFFHPRGMVMNSLDGLTWVVRLKGEAASFRCLALSDTRAVAMGEAGLITTHDFASMPTVQFTTSDASITEEGGIYTMTVSLSMIAPGVVIVPIQVSGTALIGTDASISATPVTIGAGQLTATITLTGLSDLVDEPDKTVVLTMGSALGASSISSTITVTILDDDLPPTFGSPPVGDLVVVGTAVTFSTTVTGGEPMTRQWLFNEKPISQAIQESYSISTTALSHGGAYRLQAQNPSATVKSAIAELGVVDPTSKTLAYLAGATAVLTVSATGNGLGFQWQRNGIDLVADTRISGSTSNRLVITGLTGKDAGTYRCVVSNASGRLEAGSNIVRVTTKPFIVPPTFDVLTVSQSMAMPVYAGHNPTRFYVSGLPSGLTYDPITGLISGRPLIASGSQPFQIKISASNAAGVGPTVTVPLTILSLPAGTSGSYIGTIDRATGLNATSFLGGRIQLTIATTGKISGSITLGSSTHALTSTLETFPVAQPTTLASIPRPSTSPLLVEMNFDPGNQLVTGTITAGAASTTFTARNALGTPFTSYTGYHTASIQLSSPGDVGQAHIPQGAGYMYFTIGSTGIASGLVRLADGNQFILSSPLRSNGDLVLYAPLYSNTGSALGSIKVTPGSPAIVSTGNLSWFKDQQPFSVRSYQSTFGPVGLSVTGARYTSPSAIVMDLTPTADDQPNASLVFSEGEAPSPSSRLNVLLRYSATAVRDPQTPASNPGFVAINITPSTGLMSGSFKLTDTDPTTNLSLTRTVLWNGIISRDTDNVLRGYGHFQLPKLPSLSDSPATTLNTTQILSGKVSLLPFP